MLASEREFKISGNDLKELLHLADLLHLFHHRNNNQHRRSVWYRHFSIFRRQLSQFTQYLTTLNTVATTNVGRSRKKAEDVQIVTRTHQRLEFWRDVMVARWQHGFSQVIADGRFSVLGLVLMAILAQVCQVVGITAELEDLGQAEVEKVLSQFGKEVRDWDEGTPLARSGKEDVEDQGEAIVRETEALGGDGTLDTVATPNSSKAKGITTEANATKKAKPSKKRPAESTNKPKKKRKKNGDAIDDIFG